MNPSSSVSSASGDNYYDDHTLPYTEENEYDSADACCHHRYTPEETEEDTEIEDAIQLKMTMYFNLKFIL
jgi:hypothetical protein